MPTRSLILGDSLTFGRSKHQIFYNYSWPGLLEHHGHRVFHRGRGGADSGSVLREARHLAGYMANTQVRNPLFDFCFIQVGIVDCTPRLLPRSLDKIAKTLPVIRILVNKANRSQQLLERFGRPWVNSSSFEKNILRLVEITRRLSNEIFFIEIARPTHFLLGNCGDFSALVDEYNAVLRKIPGANFLPVFDDVYLKDHFLADGHHLTKIGHQNIAEKIIGAVPGKTCV